MSACLTREYADAMADVLGGKPPNEVADLAGVTPRAVKNWQAGESGPHGAHLIRLMAGYEDVFRKVMNMTGRITGPTASPAEREAARRALAILAGD